MTAVEPTTERQPQSAAAPSPFPPIAEYAFLSNCHTGALDPALTAMANSLRVGDHLLGRLGASSRAVAAA